MEKARGQVRRSRSALCAHNEANQLEQPLPLSSSSCPKSNVHKASHMHAQTNHPTIHCSKNHGAVFPPVFPLALTAKYELETYHGFIFYRPSVSVQLGQTTCLLVYGFFVSLEKDPLCKLEIQHFPSSSGPCEHA